MLAKEVQTAQRAAADANIVAAGTIPTPAGERITSWFEATAEEFHDPDQDQELAQVGSKLTVKERAAAKTAAAVETKSRQYARSSWHDFAY